MLRYLATVCVAAAALMLAACSGGKQAPVASPSASAMSTAVALATAAPTWYQPALKAFDGVPAKPLSLSSSSPLPAGAVLDYTVDREPHRAYRDEQGRLVVEVLPYAFASLAIGRPYTLVGDSSMTHLFAAVCDGDPSRCFVQCASGPAKGMAAVFESFDGGKSWNEGAPMPATWQFVSIVQGRATVMTQQRGCGSASINSFGWYPSGEPLVPPSNLTNLAAQPRPGPDGTLAWFGPGPPVYGDGRPVPVATPRQTPFGEEALRLPDGRSLVLWRDGPPRPGLTDYTPYIGLTAPDGKATSVFGWTGPGYFKSVVGMLDDHRVVMVMQADEKGTLPAWAWVPTVVVVDFVESTVRALEPDLSFGSVVPNGGPSSLAIGRP